MKKIVVSLLLSLCTISQVHSADWQFVASSVGNEFNLFFDKDSTSTVTSFTGKIYQQAWFKHEIINELKPEDQLQVGDYVLNLWHFDCKSHKLLLKKSVYYQKDGTYLDEIKQPIPIMTNVIPSTAGELMWNKVCLGQ